MPLPDFVVAGAQKSGTTTLWTMLNHHPNIHMAKPKEVRFFDRNFESGVQWYSDRFQPGPDETTVGEVTPIYMTDEVFRQRMHNTLPHARIVVTLREPTARAYSHYWMMRAKALETLETFEEGLSAEVDRWESTPNLVGKWRFAYVRRGEYAAQLQGLESLFGRDRIHVIIMEEFLRDPPAAMRQVFEFLDVDPSPATEIELVHRKNSRRALKETKGYPPMLSKTRARLRTHFAHHITDVEDWLDRKVTLWHR